MYWLYRVRSLVHGGMLPSMVSGNHLGVLGCCHSTPPAGITSSLPLPPCLLPPCLHPPLRRRHELYTAIRGTFGGTDNLHPFPEIDVDQRFPTEWAASFPAGLCTGNNSALLSFRAPRHDFWGGGGDLELLTADTSLLDGDVTIVEVGQ